MKKLSSNILITLAFTALFWGCTKSKVDNSSLLEGNVISKTIGSAVVFIATSTKGDAYQELKRSPSFKKALNISNKLESLFTSETGPKFDRAKRIISALKDSGFLPKEDGSAETFSESVFFIDRDTTQLSAALYAEAANGTNLSQSLNTFSQALTKEGFTTSSLETSGAKGFVFSSKDLDVLAPNIYALASDSLIAVSTSKPLAERLFATNVQPGMPEIVKRDSFQKCANTITTRDKEYAISFIDFDGVLSVLTAINPGEVTPADLATFPATAGLFSTGFDGAISSEFAVAMKQGNSSEIVKTLATSGGKDLSTLGPDDSILFIGFDGSVIRSLLSRPEARQTLSQAPDNAKTLITALEKSKGLAISLRRGSGESIFPDIAFGISSDEPQVIEASIKSNFTESLGLPSASWQEKDVDGTKVQYMLTPLGVGSYFATRNDTLFVSSSESGIKSLVTSSKGVPLPTQFAKNVSSSKPFFIADINFQSLAEVVEGVQGSLAMFTGGQAPFDKAPLAELRAMDSLSIAGSAKEDVIHVFARYHEKEGPK